MSDPRTESIVDPTAEITREAELTAEIAIFVQGILDGMRAAWTINTLPEQRLEMERLLALTLEFDSKVYEDVHNGVRSAWVKAKHSVISAQGHEMIKLSVAIDLLGESIAVIDSGLMVRGLPESRHKKKG